MASPGKKSFLLRIDPALWAEVERLAAQELRSVNAQVEYLVREGLNRRGRRPSAATPADSITDSIGNSADSAPGSAATPSLPDRPTR
jgi:hypothetical protein